MMPKMKKIKENKRGKDNGARNKYFFPILFPVKGNEQDDKHGCDDKQDRMVKPDAYHTEEKQDNPVVHFILGYDLFT